MSEKTPRKLVAISLFTLILLIPLVFTASGFCYSEKKFLSDFEITKRTISLSRFRENIGSAGYESNCAPSKNPQGAGNFSDIINFFTGRKFHEIECVYPDNSTKAVANKYNWELVVVNACATRIVDFSGGPITEMEYEHYKDINQKFWKGYDR